jgi:hypothetical protein
MSALKSEADIADLRSNDRLADSNKVSTLAVYRLRRPGNLRTIFPRSVAWLQSKVPRASQAFGKIEAGIDVSLSNIDDLAVERHGGPGWSRRRISPNVRVRLRQHP